MPEVPLIGFVPLDQREAFRREAVTARLSEERVADLTRFARGKRIRLGEAVLARVRVYLDTNYWIDLQQTDAGAPPTAAHRDLLAVLRAGVSAGTIICPFAEPMFFELLKQTSPATRLACTRLMDELSGGVALQPHETRIKAELLHFVYRFRKEATEFYPFEQMAWTRAFFVLGDRVPVSEVPELNDDALRASFDDYAWTVSLEEMMSEAQNIPALPIDLDLSGLAHRLTEGKFRYAHEVRTFRDAYKAEVAGAVDSYGEIIDDTLPYLFERETGRQPPAGARDQTLRNVIAAALCKDPKRRDLPTINIQAGIHAAMRWDRDRKFKPTDWLDFMHATAALPYCSVFVTDRSLATLLSSGLLDYEDHFGCRIAHDARRTIELLTTF